MKLGWRFFVSASTSHPLLRFSTGCSFGVTVDPAQLLSHPCIDTWCVALGATISPAHNSDQGVVLAVLKSNQRTTRIPWTNIIAFINFYDLVIHTLTGVFAWVRSTEHVCGDCVAWVECGWAGALRITLGININFIKNVGLGSTWLKSSPSTNKASFSWGIWSMGSIRQAGNQTTSFP